MKIALDGPSGVGKSSIAKSVAKHYSMTYVDTGALYRAVALYVVNTDTLPTEDEKVSALLEKINVDIIYNNGEQIVLLNGEDVSGKIREHSVSSAASKVSAIPKVREFLLSLQRKIADSSDSILDGRDIGTVVLPDADVKIFLTADIRERAKRRFRQLQQTQEEIDFNTVLRDIRKRDHDDSSRKIAPLAMASDAVPVDSTKMNFEQTLMKIISIIDERMLGKK